MLETVALCVPGVLMMYIQYPCVRIGFSKSFSHLKAERKILLDKHNELRRKIAKGQELRGIDGKPQPKAADMIEMIWDPELEKSAQQ